MARGKKKLFIDKAVFQRVVDQLESTNTFPNPSYLWKAIENTEWAKGQTPRPLTAAVAYLRAKELDIVTKTKPGKRGGTMTEARIAKLHSGGRRPRSIKMTVFTDTFKEMRATYPSTLLPLIERAEKGSLKAALNLKCLECSGFVRAEIRNCACPGCSLYPHRPGATELANLAIPEDNDDLPSESEVLPSEPEIIPSEPEVLPIEPELTPEEKAAMAMIESAAAAA
jgi:hypothetical protein